MYSLFFYFYVFKFIYLKFILNREIMTWAEIKCQMLNRLSPPGGPKFPLFIRTAVILDEGPTLLQHDLILTNCISSDLRRSLSEILGVKASACELWENTIQSIIHIFQDLVSYRFFRGRQRLLSHQTEIRAQSPPKWPGLSRVSGTPSTVVHSKHTWWVFSMPVPTPCP